MIYPTFEEIEAASHFQLAYWCRFLPSPGATSIEDDNADFETALSEELTKLNRILERHQEFGGWNSSISKAVGWDN